MVGVDGGRFPVVLVLLVVFGVIIFLAIIIVREEVVDVRVELGGGAVHGVHLAEDLVNVLVVQALRRDSRGGIRGDGAEREPGTRARARAEGGEGGRAEGLRRVSARARRVVLRDGGEDAPGGGDGASAETRAGRAERRALSDPAGQGADESHGGALAGAYVARGGGGDDSHVEALSQIPDAGDYDGRAERRPGSARRDSVCLERRCEGASKKRRVRERGRGVRYARGGVPRRGTSAPKKRRLWAGGWALFSTSPTA